MAYCFFLNLLEFLVIGSLNLLLEILNLVAHIPTLTFNLRCVIVILDIDFRF